MTGDWLLLRLDAVEQAALTARNALDNVAQVLAPARTQRAAGQPLALIALDLSDRAAERRRDTARAFAEFEKAVAALRASIVRVLVDEEGASFSALARAMGISRQAVTRLYEAAETANTDHR